MWDLLKVGFECGMCSKVFQMGLFGLKCIKGRNGRVDNKNKTRGYFGITEKYGIVILFMVS